MEVALDYLNQILEEENGDAIVEATFVFPVMIFIIMGLIMLCIYMPTQGVLQYATQRAANAVSIELSDTWIRFDENAMEFYTIENYEKLNEEAGVYISALSTIFTDNNKLVEKGTFIVNKLYDESIAIKTGPPLEVDVAMNNAIIYKEITVTAKKTIPIGLNLSFIGFPSELTIESTSTAVVQNGDEMVRNMDIARDVARYVDETYEIKDMFISVGEILKFGKNGKKE